MQHVILLAILKSYRFFLHIKDRLCPLLPDGRTFRPDFTIPDFNPIFSTAANVWTTLPAPETGDVGLKAAVLSIQFVQLAEKNLMSVEDAGRLVKWVETELADSDLDMAWVQEIPNTPMFLKWSEGRAIEHEQRRLSPLVLGRNPTFQDWMESGKAIQRTQADLFPPIVDAATFVAEKITPPIELVAGVFHQGSKLSLSGGSKMFKSWLLLNLGISVAAGEPYLCFKTTQARVLFVNLEIPKWSLQQRIQAIANTRGITIKPGELDIWNLRGHSASFDTVIPRILQQAKDRGYSLIILDPVYKLYGLIDENSANGVALLMNSIESLSVETGAGVAFGAHYSKGNQASKEAIDRTSGSGVFARDPDTILNFTRHEVEDAFTVEVTLRSLKPVPPFVVRWQFPLMVRDNGLDPTKLKKQNGNASGHDSTVLLQVLPDEGLETEKWRRLAEEQLKIKKSAFYDHKDRLAASGVIILMGKKWKLATCSTGSEVPKPGSESSSNEKPQN